MHKQMVTGIDLACSERNPSAYALLDETGCVMGLDCFWRDEDLFRLLQASHDSLVAIDAPLSLPRGLHCLDEHHSCPSAGDKGRVCEEELAHMGIGCFRTNKRSIIKAMVYRGIKLKEALTRAGHRVIEVYPYATKVQIWRKPIPRKSTREGLAFLQQHLLQILSTLEGHEDNLNADLCDALVAAYTGWRFLQGQYQRLGDAEEGWLIVPEPLLS